MKKNIYISVFALLITVGNMFVSCDKNEFDATPIDESQYVVSDESIGYLTDENGKMEFGLTEIRHKESSDIKLFLNSSKILQSDASVTLSYDETVLATYNEETENEYEIFPTENVLIEAGGGITILNGSQKSEGLNVSITVPEVLIEGKTYAIPLKVKSESGNLKFTKTTDHYIIFVKVSENLGDCNKGESAVKLFSVMEANDTNPLNHLCFTLKNSKKYLFDAVVLFSDNLFLDKETGTVHALVNKEVVHILNNQEKYLKPLRDRGMKVLLSIMPHHTHAGIGNLKPETAKAVARHLKTICDTYHLDGIYLDDEWQKDEYPTPPGFYERGSFEAAANFMYEIKRMMPDKVTVAFAYGYLTAMNKSGCTIDGKGPEYYADYVMANYNVQYDFERNYPGVPKNRWGMYSQEFNRGYWTKADSKLQEIKENNGVHFVFAMSPYRDSFNKPWQDEKPNQYGSTQLKQLEQIARVFYDDELVYDGKPYPADWKKN